MQITIVSRQICDILTKWETNSGKLLAATTDIGSNTGLTLSEKVRLDSH